MFPASTTSLAYDTSTTYRRAVQGGVTIPLLGLQGNQLLTIPCFATSRVDSATASLTTQTDTSNVQTIAISPTERKVYFGAWLDINQTAPQFPLNPYGPRRRDLGRGLGVARFSVVLATFTLLAVVPHTIPDVP